uniref:Uncharacterized protein n=1 Tax=Aotus nancymaae TaxID=37293 RepID=A0A2K5D061_AOTNA
MARRLRVMESRRRCCSPCFLSKPRGKCICIFRPVKFCHYFSINLLYIRATEYNAE